MHVQIEQPLVEIVLSHFPLASATLAKQSKLRKISSPFTLTFDTVLEVNLLVGQSLNPYITA